MSWRVPSFVLLLALGCAPEAPRPRAIFLLVVDTLRADRLSSYSDEAPSTPAIDALVRSGVRFTRAQAVGGWTLPSMGAMLTSRLPRELGMIERRDDPDWPTRKGQRRRLYRMPLIQDARSLAELLDEAGFETAAFVNQPMLAPRRGFDRGFDHWVQASGDGRLVLRQDLDHGNRQRWDSTLHAWENDGLLVDAFQAWLAEQAARTDGPPLFAWLHLLTPHRPYRPPAAFAPEGSDPDLAALYDAEVRAVDVLVGRALDAIDAQVGRDQSVVVFTSDHGEAFGEHGAMEHGGTLHVEVMQVPLAIRAPGWLPVGRDVDAVVRTLDIAPTLLSLAGVEAPPEMRGESLLPLLAGGESRVVVAEGLLSGATEQVVIADGFKLLVDEEDAQPALFSMDEDPGERRDLAAEEPERVSALRRRLDALEGLRLPRRRKARVEEDEETLEALRALGYLEPL